MRSKVTDYRLNVLDPSIDRVILDFVEIPCSCWGHYFKTSSTCLYYSGVFAKNYCASVQCFVFVVLHAAVSTEDEKSSLFDHEFVLFLKLSFTDY